MGGFAIASLMIFLAIVVVGVTTLAVAMARTGQQTASRLFPDGAGGAPAPATTGGGGSTPNGGNNNIDWDAIATKVDAGVVDINTQLGLENAQAAGTGIVIDPSGIVLTNNHVIAGATRIRVTTVVDGQSYDGSVIGYNRSADVAVLQLAGVSGLSTVSLGDSSKVRVGDPVLAIGNAGGKGGTPATAPGTVTALDQTITASDEATGSSERLTGLIEVRANIEAGDSGGPLVDVDGKVIGIDTAASAEFQVQASGGQGFAIPINQAMSIGGEIRAGHASSTIHIGETAFLGVQITNKSGSTSGASVSGTVSGSPAAQAGLAAGDVIKSVDGHTVDSPSDLTTLLDTHHPGDRVSVGWVDSSGRSHTATVTLAKGPAG
jgi:S1-C subfamily serine protease